MKKSMLFLVSLLMASPIMAHSELQISEANYQGPEKKGTQLKHWPKDKAIQIEQLIKNNAFQKKFAVFDMDNTSYQHDVTEALLPYLEQKGVLTRENLDSSLKIIPFKDTRNYKESLYSYYVRLCNINHLVCYPWIAQAFSGLEFSEVKRHVDTMIRQQKPIHVEYYKGNQRVKHTVKPPKIFPGMVELYNKLQENGIEVYVVTAANEEIVRMVASDPKYGYNVKPENVYGVNVLLKNKFTKELTTSHIQLQENKYNQAQNLRNMKFTSYLMNPMTWYEGKYGTIVGWIDQWKKPILAAGDTPKSDGYMLLNGVDVEHGGLRIWINRKSKYTSQMKEWAKIATVQQQSLRQPVTADKNWLIIQPSELHGK